MAECPARWKGVEGQPVLVEAGAVAAGDGTVRIPYRLPGGGVHAWRVCAPDGRCWWEPPGRALIPLGLETLRRGLPAHTRAVLVAEGESDTFALRAAYAGTEVGHPVSGIEVIGLPGAHTWRPEWRALLEGYPLIYLLGDGDDAGRTMNAAVQRDVPWARPVWLPNGADARAMLEGGGSRALDPYLQAADAEAHARACFILGRDLGHCEALLRGWEVRRLA